MLEKQGSPPNNDSRLFSKCFAEGCERQVKAKGLCDMHWKRQRKGKDINKKSVKEMLTYERFWSYVEEKGLDDCWIWQGSTGGRGDMVYGRIQVGGSLMGAHRYSWLIENGEIPDAHSGEKMYVCHSCDTPLCVNPKHLFLGTHTDNMRDKINKGRCPMKSKTRCSKGHEYNEKNTYTSKSGLRHCRQCHKERESKRRERLRA